MFKRVTRVSFNLCLFLEHLRVQSEQTCWAHLAFLEGSEHSPAVVKKARSRKKKKKWKKRIWWCVVISRGIQPIFGGKETPMCSTLETECSQAFCTVGFHSRGVFDSVLCKSSCWLLAGAEICPKAELRFQAGEGRGGGSTGSSGAGLCSLLSAHFPHF